MKQCLICLYLFAIILPSSFYAQTNLPLKQSPYSVGSTLTYFSNPYPFKIDEATGLLNQVTNFTSPWLNIGLTTMYETNQGYFVSISITRFSNGQDSEELSRNFSINPKNEAKSTLLGMRYEVGKYFGKKMDQPLTFGLSAAIDGTGYRYKKSFSDATISNQVFKFLSAKVSIIPTLTIQHKKQIAFDIKGIPSWWIKDVGVKKTSFTNQPPTKDSVDINKNNPEFNFAVSFGIRYLLLAKKKD